MLKILYTSHVCICALDILYVHMRSFHNCFRCSKLKVVMSLYLCMYCMCACYTAHTRIYYENLFSHWKAPLSMNITVVGIVTDSMAPQPNNSNKIMISMSPFTLCVSVNIVYI